MTEGEHGGRMTSQRRWGLNSGTYPNALPDGLSLALNPPGCHGLVDTLETGSF